jgi:hypothetical protein
LSKFTQTERHDAFKEIAATILGFSLISHVNEHARKNKSSIVSKLETSEGIFSTLDLSKFVTEYVSRTVRKTGGPAAHHREKAKMFLALSAPIRKPLAWFDGWNRLSEPRIFAIIIQKLSSCASDHCSESSLLEKDSSKNNEGLSSNLTFRHVVRVGIYASSFCWIPNIRHPATGHVQGRYLLWDIHW